MSLRPPSVPLRAFRAPKQPDRRADSTGSVPAEPGVLPIGRQRNDAAYAPLAPSDILKGGDVLFFAGSVSLAQTLHAHPDLERAFGQGLAADEPRTLYEAVLSGSSSLVGQTLRSTAFRERYRAVVLAIHREDSALPGRLGQIRLQAGDLLLLEAQTTFYERAVGNRDDFYFVAPYRLVSPAPRRHKPPLALSILGAMVVSAATGIVPLLTAALTAGLDPEAHSAHSLRVCFITQAVTVGKAEGRVKEHSGHASWVTFNQ